MAAASERVFEFLEEEEEEQIAANPVPTDNIRGEVELSTLSSDIRKTRLLLRISVPMLSQDRRLLSLVQLVQVRLQWLSFL